MGMLAPLNCLLKAPDKRAVEKVINLVFVEMASSSSQPQRSSTSSFLPEGCAGEVQELLDLPNESQEEAFQLVAALQECISVSLYSNRMEDLAALYEQEGQEVNAKLKSMIGSIITAKLGVFREAAIANRVSLPKYVDMNWAINMKKCSSKIPAMNVPTVLLKLQVQGQVTRANEVPDLENIDVELNKPAIETLLDGLGKIRDQLSSLG